MSVAVTNRSNFVIGGLASPSNPCDSHISKRALDQVRTSSGQRIEDVFVGRGYRNHDESDSLI